MRSRIVRSLTQILSNVAYLIAQIRRVTQASRHRLESSINESPTNGDVH